MGGGDFLEDIVDVVAQVSTGGLVGFEGGGFKGGVTTQAGVSGLKDVTGATAAEEANEQARERFEEEKQKAVSARQEAKAKTARNQLIASRLASGARRGNRISGSGGTNKSSTLGSDESDFLGL